VVQHIYETVEIFEFYFLCSGLLFFMASSLRRTLVQHYGKRHWSATKQFPVIVSLCSRFQE